MERTRNQQGIDSSAGISEHLADKPECCAVVDTGHSRTVLAGSGLLFWLLASSGALPLREVLWHVALSLVGMGDQIC